MISCVQTTDISFHNFDVEQINLIKRNNKKRKR